GSTVNPREARAGNEDDTRATLRFACRTAPRFLEHARGTRPIAGSATDSGAPTQLGPRYQ
ncbi:hypothetical protein E2562_001270, partial [Oryza meyeriana var. granulata]